MCDQVLSGNQPQEPEGRNKPVFNQVLTWRCEQTHCTLAGFENQFLRICHLKICLLLNPVHGEWWSIQHSQYAIFRYSIHFRCLLICTFVCASFMKRDCACFTF